MLLQRLRQSRQVLRPPPDLNLPDWADDHRHLSPEASSTPGKWRTSRVEAARGPMEAITDPRVHIVTVMCCTQFMKTELILNTIGFFTHQDPAPMIVMQPTVKIAEAFSKDRVAPMFRDSPVLKGILSANKSREGGNTILHKQFPGGHLTMVGANAPGDLAMRPVRIVLCDEVDKYPGSAGDEGDPISVLGERAATFWNWKQIRTCSPTLEPDEDGNGSRIAMSYEESDKRIFCPQCPHCGERAEMLWHDVQWPKGRPDLALYHCPACSKPWSETERKRAIKATRFLPNRGWIATAPFAGHAGFKVNKLASPWETVCKLAVKFVAAQRSPELLKVFLNTQLAETWKEQGESPEWEKLYDRREDYPLGVIPRGGLVVTAAADVQRGPGGGENGWIEVVVYAWGRNLERWVIDHQQFHGDTSDNSKPGGPWEKLKALRESFYPHESSGVAVPVSVLAVDSGDQTQTVYDWCASQPAGTVMAVKGQPNGSILVSSAKPIQIKPNGKRVARQGKLWNISLNIAKSELYQQLKYTFDPDNPEAPLGRGFIHFPELDQEFFEQMCSEQMVLKRVKGRQVQEWQKIRARNEVLDCTIYNRAAANLLGIDTWSEENWRNIEESLGIDDRQESEESVEKPTRRKSDYWKRRR